MVQMTASQRAKIWRLENPDRYKDWSRKHYQINKEKIKERTFWNKVKRFYGLTKEQYEQMIVDQNNQCAICSLDFSNLKRKPDVDHCHKTGKVRALLCWNCNGGLGQYNDDPTLFRKAAEYLEKHQ